jgi:3-hydroxyisobutyryl-CoA hydrolase
VHLRLEIINKCFSKRTVEEIISSLVSLLDNYRFVRFNFPYSKKIINVYLLCQEQVASNMADEWAAETIRYLKRASPTSLKITMRSVFLKRLNPMIVLLIYDLCCVQRHIFVF